ncbi:Uncharacterised protein [Shigella sonnei]|nr:Uncharacterised protein [Shigella sonnei]
MFRLLTDKRCVVIKQQPGKLGQTLKEADDLIADGVCHLFVTQTQRRLCRKAVTIQPVRSQQYAFLHLLPQRHIGTTELSMVICHHIGGDRSQWSTAIAFRLGRTGDVLPKRMAAQTVALR